MGFSIDENITDDLDFVYDDEIGTRLYMHKYGDGMYLSLSLEEMTKLFVLWLRCMDWKLSLWDHMKLDNRIACRQLKPISFEKDLYK